MKTLNKYNTLINQFKALKTLLISYLMLIIIFTGCAPIKPIIETKTVYVKQKLIVNDELTNKKNNIEVPSINYPLTIEDEFKIKNYVFNLYLRNKEYETDRLILKTIIEAFNKDSNLTNKEVK
jgi:hypothetical protein